MKSSNRRTVTLNIDLFKIVYIVRDSNVLHSGGDVSVQSYIYIYEISGADRCARETQTIYVGRTYLFIKAFCMNFFT